MGCSNCRAWPDEDAAENEIVMVEVPEGVTIAGGGGAMATLPPPQPAKPSVTKKMAAERTPKGAKRFLLEARANAR